MKKLLLALSVASCLYGTVEAKALKVLMIGNSFSICVLKEMPKCVAAAGDKLDLASLYIGGCPLDRHWANVEKASDPAFKPYTFTWSYASAENPVAPLGKHANIPQALTADRWDIVTIQQASGKSCFPETYEPYAGKLIAKIRELAPQAEIVIQETWSYTPFDSRLKTWKMTPATMHEALQKAYAQLAARYRLRTIPVGDAVQLYRKRRPVDYGQPPTAEEIAAYTDPAQLDLHGDVVGGATLRKADEGGKKKLGRIKIDPAHLNASGHYLQALVWQAELFGTDVTRQTYRPAGIPEETATLMRRCAQDAVAAGRSHAQTDSTAETKK